MKVNNFPRLVPSRSQTLQDSVNKNMTIVPIMGFVEYGKKARKCGFQAYIL